MRFHSLRRALAALALGALAACSAPPSPAAAATTTPKLVVLIVVDTLRADHLGAWGYPRPTSPALDAWARGGALFRSARSQASCTFPSVNSLLTSREPARFLGQPANGMGIPDGVPSIAELFHAAGWRTLAVSASPIVRNTPSPFNPGGGFGRGFDVFDESCSWRPAACVDRAARRLLAASRQKPTLLYLHYLDPHAPYRAPAAWLRDSPRFVHGPSGIDFVDAGDPRPIAQAIAAGTPLPALGTKGLAALVDRYDEEIAYLDAELGGFLRELDRTHPGALVALASDHGEAFLEHRNIKHCGTVFDEEVHTPLVLRGPGIPSRRIAAPVANLDLLPTLLDYAALPRPPSLEGRSLRAHLEGPAPPAAEVSSMINTVRALVVGRHKVTLDLGLRRATLYDLVADPGETTDLAERDPRRTRELLGRLQRRLRAVEPDADAGAARGLEAERRLRSLGYLD